MKNKLNFEQVLRRYVEEDLPEFCELTLSEVNQIGNFGNAPLHVAAVRGDLAELRALLDGGADVNMSGEFGNTPLHEAVGQQNKTIVRALISLPQTRLTLRNDDGLTAYDLALAKRDPELIELFTSKQA